jgi:predicted acylesterase/phospholipase RssA
MSRPEVKTALCLPGGGITGALYQIGALAALQDGIRGLDGQSFSLYLGQSSGASVAAALAGGVEVDRLYRALLDPASDFFPLERSHIFHVDIDEWRRALGTTWLALRHAAERLIARPDPAAPAPAHLYLWEQIDRFADSLPSGLFTLDRYERFLAECFFRRGVPNAFREMPRALRIATHDVDSGDCVVFGAEGHDDIPVSLACAASLASPLFFSPVRIGHRHFIDGGLGHVAHLDIAVEMGVDFAIVVNPMVPVSVDRRAVPTGHGIRESIRDKGLFWVQNQATRIGAHVRLRQHVEEIRRTTKMMVLVLEPEPTDVLMFLHNPANLAARRAILEVAYRTTRDRIEAWMGRNRDVVERLGWERAE